MQELRTDRFKLKEVFPTKAKKYAQSLHKKATELEFIRKGIPIDPDDIEIKEGERAAIRLITTPHLDRDGEILIPSGAILDDFRQSPSVLYGHDYKGLPVGSDQWIKQVKEGILAKTVYAKHQFAEDVYQCVIGKHLNSNSVGFIPIEAVNPEDNKKEFAEWQGVLEKNYGIDKEESGKAKAIYTKWIMLEHSDVPVASNAQSLNLAVSKGELVIQSDRLKKDLEIEVVKDTEIEVTKGKDGVTIFGRKVVDSETGKPIKKEDMKDEGIEVVKDGYNFDNLKRELVEKGFYESEKDIGEVKRFSKHINFDDDTIGIQLDERVFLVSPDGKIEETGETEVAKGKKEIILSVDGKQIAALKEEDVFKIEAPEGISDKKEKEIEGEKAETAGAKEEKVETTDKYHRIPVNTSCKITATITISASKGIKALYCGKEKKVHTYLFDVAKFSMAEAKAWVKENHKDIDIESMAEKVEPIEEVAAEADKEEEKQEEFKCECIKCGWKHTSEKHCDTYKCEKCGGEMRRVERPGPGKNATIYTGSIPIEEIRGLATEYVGYNSLESAIKDLTSEVTELKEGRVLSTKNRTLVKDIRDLIRDLDGKLTSLLDATEPTSREEERAVSIEHQVIIEKDDDKVGMDKLATAIENALSGDSLKKMLDKSLGEAVEVAIKKKLGKVE